MGTEDGSARGDPPTSTLRHRPFCAKVLDPDPLSTWQFSLIFSIESQENHNAFQKQRSDVEAIRYFEPTRLSFIVESDSEARAQPTEDIITCAC